MLLEVNAALVFNLDLKELFPAISASIRKVVRQIIPVFRFTIRKGKCWLGMPLIGRGKTAIVRSQRIASKGSGPGRLFWSDHKSL